MPYNTDEQTERSLTDEEQDTLNRVIKLEEFRQMQMGISDPYTQYPYYQFRRLD